MDVNETRMSKLLNHMTDYLLSGQEIEFSECVLDWYRQGYECGKVPRPDDNTGIRMAVKASIIERLVEVLNSPPHSEQHSVPEWCGLVEGLDKPLKLQSDRLLEGEDYCPAFEKRNLLVVKNFMFFI